MLDPILPEFVGLLVKFMDLNRSAESRFSAQTEEAFRYLKKLALTVGYKLIASLLSHEVSLLESLLSALEFYVNSELINFLLLTICLLRCQRNEPRYLCVANVALHRLQEPI